VTFPWILRFPPPYNWNIVEIGIKHHKPKSTYMYIGYNLSTAWNAKFSCLTANQKSQFIMSFYLNWSNLLKWPVFTEISQLQFPTKDTGICLDQSNFAIHMWLSTYVTDLVKSTICNRWSFKTSGLTSSSLKWKSVTLVIKT
jgi:hypothetical protein